jgi:hypothetical protein
MLSIITALITVCGSAGFSSVLKMVAGFLDSWRSNRELTAKTHLAAVLQMKSADTEFQKALFAGETNKYARQTRRIISIVSILILGFIMVWSCIHPDQKIVTTTNSESMEGKTRNDRTRKLVC